ncbi:MAG TPA: ABC transporter permease [Candidatus Acidoferrum sp.]|nr:ABC transporter permease [Candidatus Acidoferrum sp.]
MYLRIVAESFARSPRRKFITGAALALGMAVATATLTVALSVGDRLAAEFRSLGANLLVIPKTDTLPLEIGGVDYRPANSGGYLFLKDLPKLKQMFWRNNIVGFAPFTELPAEIMDDTTAPRPWGGRVRTTVISTWHQRTLDIGNGEIFVTGVEVTHPWWRIKEGRWWSNDTFGECVVGAALARVAKVHVGDQLEIGWDQGEAFLTVVGIISTGGPEDNAILKSTSLQPDALSGKFRRLVVSAIVKPDDALGRQDPATMTPAEVERWSCSAYISSIAANIKEALPGVEVRPILQVSQGEGQILGRISTLLWVVTLAALIAAGLAVGAVAATTVLERQKEIGLMKALGANKWLVGSFFLGEQILLAVFGGGLGFAIGVLLARWLSLSVFGVVAPAKAILLPVAMGLAILVVLSGSLYPLRRAARFDPAPILRGE